MRPCGTCGQPVERWPSALAHGEQAFCSRRCAGAAARRTVQRTCRQCGALFERRPGRERRGPLLYCSRRCAAAARGGPRVERACATCGAVIAVPPSWRRRRYCGRACYAEAQALAVRRRPRCPVCQGQWLRAGRKFCSVACAGQGQGRHRRRPADERRVRRILALHARGLNARAIFDRLRAERDPWAAGERKTTQGAIRVAIHRAKRR